MSNLSKIRRWLESVYPPVKVKLEPNLKKIQKHKQGIHPTRPNALWVLNSMYVWRLKVKYCSDESSDISHHIYTSAKFNIYIKIQTNKLTLMVRHMTSGWFIDEECKLSCP